MKRSFEGDTNFVSKKRRLDEIDSVVSNEIEDSNILSNDNKFQNEFHSIPNDQSIPNSSYNNNINNDENEDSLLEKSQMNKNSNYIYQKEHDIDTDDGNYRQENHYNYSFEDDDYIDNQFDANEEDQTYIRERVEDEYVDEQENEDSLEENGGYTNDDFVQYDINEIYVPGEEKSSKHRFDEELNQTVDAFSMNDERNSGRFLEETGMWVRDKYNVRDDWLDETIDQMESGRFQPIKKNGSQYEAYMDEEDSIEYARKLDIIERDCLITIIRSINLFLQDNPSEEWNITLSNVLSQFHEFGPSEISEKELGEAIGRICNLQSYDNIDIYNQSLSFFYEKIERFQEIGIKWEYKWNPEDEEIHGPFTSEEMNSWIYARYFSNQPVHVRKCKNDEEDMFEVDETINTEQFVPIEKIIFELYK